MVVIQNFFVPDITHENGSFASLSKIPNIRKHTTKFDHIDTLAYNPTRLDFFDYFWYKYLVVLLSFGKKILQQCYYQLNLTQKHRPSIPIPPLTLQNNKNHQKTVLTKKMQGGALNWGMDRDKGAKIRGTLYAGRGG